MSADQSPHDAKTPAGVAEQTFREEALDWFVRLQAAEADPATQRAFRTWSESDPRRAAAFAEVTALWGEPEFLGAAKNVAQATKLSAKRGPSRRRRSTTVAITGIFLIWCAAQLPDLLLWMRADYMTATGEQRTVTLPDGSRMVLNTASAVSVDFDHGGRNVKVLEGQAFFDVAHDVAHPFIVEGNFSRVRVTGTAFDVRLDSEIDDVALARGKVDVGRINQPADRTDLLPGQAVDIGAVMMSAVRSIDTASQFAWVEGRITFNEQPFGAILKQLQRYYRGRVVVWNSALDKTAVSGSYRLDDPGLAIRSLAEAAGAEVTTLPGLIILR